MTSGLFELFLTPSLFHGGAFQSTARIVFTFLISSLVIDVLPVEITKSLSLENFFVIGFIAVIWFLFSLKLFNMGG